MNTPTHIVKRSGVTVPFKADRIMNAIYRAAVAVGGRDRERARWLTEEVVKILTETNPAGHTPHIEELGYCRESSDRKRARQGGQSLYSLSKATQGYQGNRWTTSRY